MSADEFYDLSPRQLSAMTDRFERAIVDRELLFAQLTCWTVNTSMARPKEPAKIQDFMPSEWIKQSIARGSPITETQRKAVIEQVRAVAKTFMRDQDGTKVHDRGLGR